MADTRDQAGWKADAGIRPALPRTQVQATFPDGRVFQAPPGTPIGDLINVAFPTAEVPLVAAIVDRRLREFTFALDEDAAIEPLSTATADGARIYRRSLSFLLLVAVDEVFPGTEVYIEHAATNAGGYFCEVKGRGPFTQEELQVIERRMREIVAEDAPITRALVSVADAIALFESRHETDKSRLLRHREKDTLVLYTLHARRDYFQGYMVPSAGYLKHFALYAFAPGFLLQFPHQQAPLELTPFTPYPKLFTVFEQAGDWLDRLGIRNAGALNDAIAGDRLREVSLVAEAWHEARIAQIARRIAAGSGKIRVVLVAGPSSAGKTTFSKRLAVQLLVSGLRPMPVGLDDYFVDREHTPLDANGELDYETIGALDLDLFNEHLRSLIEGNPTTLPHYNFLTGRREIGPTVTLERDSVVIVEGIHGLNPALVPTLPPESVFRIYVSALTELNLDRHNRVSTTDCRLIRRIVRDASTRGYTACATLRRWPSVVRGEKQHIFCFQENADAIFNSALVHELAVLRPFAEPLILQVRPDTTEYLEANRLLSFLQWFKPAQADLVPDNSILREFIGGSILEYLHIWPNPPAGIGGAARKA
ncbi:MAG: nucleoside kinase [Acidobacteria bacterium]|nr:nucleoside kinase [Acidobacteriota bacterium]